MAKDRAKARSDIPLEVSDELVVALAADLDGLAQELVAVVRAFCLVHVDHQLLHNLHQVLLGHHAIEQVEGAQTDALIFVIQTL